MPDLLMRKEATVSHITQTHAENSFFFFIALLLFLAAGAAYGGLFFLIKAETNMHDGIISKIQDQEKNLQPERIEKIFLMENRLKNIGTLLNQHTFAGNVFRIIEADTHPQVRFVSFGFVPGDYKADMSGQAQNYAVLSQQINILERELSISHVEFGGLSVAESGSVGFHATITFNPVILQNRPENTPAQPTPQSLTPQPGALTPQTQP